MNTYNRLNTDQIKRACDKFFERRGEKKLSYRDQMEINAKKGKKQRQQKSKEDRIAEELSKEPDFE
tara:strand:- start:245 stop:442 length:198 start_codon:yes stop_codon:yes gene_type:complete